MTESDEILVGRAQRGNQAAFEELVRRTSRLIFARLYLETGDSHRAEDLLQETLLTAYRTLGQLTKPDKFRGWLLRIAQNLAVDAARRDSRKKRTPDPDILKFRQDAAEVPRPDEHAEKEELREQVLAILRDLPEEYRLVLTLRYLVGADFATIQQQMGLTNGALRGLLHRGMQRMRIEMQKLMGEPIAQIAA
ncbi:MAG: sigma-70 family RNA polymerase sigma factor, partial [Planctomycetes bacterium]|nr:sigma-70 family RNA polymerase sigma factor [Planctomycetota bacterium]